ncbi:hypothetical protein Leryth_001942 [Lithospermum erythrorhizon]|nr:hypothetical protein Leryth_001942 [Lithospermum erythrorhizon]
MAETRRFCLNAQLDIEQILQEAQHRWLRPTEICEILQNYQKFRIAPEPPTRPPSGSLFLFDRKVLRYFRKDGHNWRKKRDGKTVKEAHERLKAGSVDVLHCYYAHGQENENFQRRSYWMLEEALSNIVLVHYREVKGSRTNYNRIKDVGEAVSSFPENKDVEYSEVVTSSSSKIMSHDYQGNSQITDTASLSSAQASEFEDAESAYSSQANSGFQSFMDSQQPSLQKMNDRFGAPYYPVSSSSDYQIQLPTTCSTSVSLPGQGGTDTNVEAVVEYVTDQSLDLPFKSYQYDQFQPSFSTMTSNTISMTHVQGNEMLNQVIGDGLDPSQGFRDNGGCLEEWQNPGIDVSCVSNWTMNQKAYMGSPFCPPDSLNEGSHVGFSNMFNVMDAPSGKITHPMQNSPVHKINADIEASPKPELPAHLSTEEKADHSSLKQPFLFGLKEGLKKLDSFDRWMSKEFEDVNDTHIHSNSGTYWEAVGNDDVGDDSDLGPQVPLDSFVLPPSISQDQYFSITDFSPVWAYAGSETKVLIMGQFMKSQKEVENCKWACMFGELEVPAEVIGAGILRCHTPVHKPGRVPFYITLSNRLACSEVRDFEFRVSISPEVDISDSSNSTASESVLLMRFARLLSIGSPKFSTSVSSSESDTTQLCSRFSSLLMEEKYDWEKMLNSNTEEESSIEKIKDQILHKLLKEKLYYWILEKIVEDGKGPSELDESGQGVLHLAAALDYDWAMPPMIAAGVSINFRDVSGWTALHWAALYGRERTVCSLIALGAAAGLLTDPTPKYPTGRTPADLASSNGHKGIAGLLAESALVDLSSHLQSLDLKDSKGKDKGESSGSTPVHTISERISASTTDGDSPLKDSLAAVRNATQAAARIFQVYRVQSFQRKKLNEYSDGEFGISDQRALSLTLKMNRAGQDAAAIRIQNKFRSWKGRKEFLLIRQRVIKIQAHFRGHQVRRKHNIIWSVGILEKVVLRWRRKGSGLRGFRPEMATDSPSLQDESLKEDDYDVLKEGRRQTEERMQKALDRVKSMVQYKTREIS